MIVSVKISVGSSAFASPNIRLYGSQTLEVALNLQRHNDHDSPREILFVFKKNHSHIQKFVEFNINVMKKVKHNSNSIGFQHFSE